MAHDMLRCDQAHRASQTASAAVSSPNVVDDQHAPFRFDVGIADIDLQQETVELRFGQRIGAFLLQRILRGQHMERTRQIVTLARHRHMPLLHRLQQRGLRARAGAVDFVRHQQAG